MCGTKKLIYNMKRKAKRGDCSATHSIKDREGTLIAKPDNVRKRRKEYFQELNNPDVDSADVMRYELSATV